jgi:hypothetical protein
MRHFKRRTLVTIGIPFFSMPYKQQKKKILCKEFFDASLYNMVLMPLDFIQGLCNTTSIQKVK